MADSITDLFQEAKEELVGLQASIALEHVEDLADVYDRLVEIIEDLENTIPILDQYDEQLDWNDDLVEASETFLVIVETTVRDMEWDEPDSKYAAILRNAAGAFNREGRVLA